MPCPSRTIHSKVEVVWQQGIEVYDDGVNMGNYEACLIVDGCVIIEVKAVQALDCAHGGRCLNYLRGTGLVTRLLVNFGKAKIQVRRLSTSPKTGTGDVDLKVDELQSFAFRLRQRLFDGDEQ